jgi:diguanylate cyclase (GGDEF)-like protein
MSDAQADRSWGTSQLVEYLAVLSGQPDERTAARAAVERALESLDAEIGVLFNPDLSVSVAIGFEPGDPRLCALVRAALDGQSTVDTEGLWPCQTAVVSLNASAESPRLLVARLGSSVFTQTELLLLRGMAWVLDLAGRQLRMLSAVNERQRMLEHLARVQQGIVARDPLPEVFDIVAESVLSLVGSEYAALHLLDRDGLAVASVRAVDPARLPPAWAQRKITAVAEAVLRDDDLVRMGPGPHGRSAMGAPVRENGAVVGALVVIAPQTAASFAPGQQQALQTFADQVSVALSDAKGQLAAQHAVRDPVTGLPNRVLFLDQMESALASRRRLQVIFLDLDRFKHVNDTHGHAVGDDVLRTVGHRLRDTLRGPGMLARFGGDEYAVLMEDATSDDARACAERMLAAVKLPCRVGTEVVAVGGSIGVAAARLGSSAPDVLRNADVAMYQAKHAGGDRIVVFSERLSPVRTGRRSVETELRRAIDGDDLQVVFQPMIGLADGRIHAAEALARWNRPAGAAIGPADFIPVAEETGLIRPLGRQVLHTACRQAAAWNETSSGAGPSVSVNVSPRQLHDSAFLSDVRRVLADTQLESGRLILEVTESTMVSDLDTVLELMLHLRELGVRLAIDDFGTGYSSLSYLRMFPVEILKIDRSFVEGVVAPWQGQAFVQAIVRLAHALSMTTVAEGVETEEQVQALLDAGCEIGQGFLLARPMSSADIAAYITTHLGEPADTRQRLQLPGFPDHTGERVRPR